MEELIFILDMMKYLVKELFGDCFMWVYCLYIVVFDKIEFIECN